MSSLSLEGGGTGCRGKGGEGSLRGCPAWQGSRSWVGGRRSSQSRAYCLMVKKQQGIVEWEKSRRESQERLDHPSPGTKEEGRPTPTPSPFGVGGGVRMVLL